jgi:hypothetical protein
MEKRLRGVAMGATAFHAHSALAVAPPSREARNTAT